MIPTKASFNFTAHNVMHRMCHCFQLAWFIMGVAYGRGPVVVLSLSGGFQWGTRFVLQLIGKQILYTGKEEKSEEGCPRTRWVRPALQARSLLLFLHCLLLPPLFQPLPSSSFLSPSSPPPPSPFILLSLVLQLNLQTRLEASATCGQNWFLAGNLLQDRCYWN